MRDSRYRAPNAIDDGRCLPAAPRKHDRERKDGQNKENGELEVLTTAQKFVEVPIVFGPWHDREQKTGEQEEKPAAHGMGRREAIDGSLPSEQGFPEPDSRSELVQGGSNREQSERNPIGDSRFCLAHRDPDLAERSRFYSLSVDSCHL